MKLEATFRPINASLFEACHATTQLGGIILKELAEYPQEDLSVRIIINTVSRVIRTTSSIFFLCSIGDTQSGWILHRTLAERFFHLTHLSATNSYDDFEEWSFYEQANYQQKTASDPLFKGRLKDKSYFLTDDQKKNGLNS